MPDSPSDTADGGFALDLDEALLTEAVAAVESRIENARKRSQGEVDGPEATDEPATSEASPPPEEIDIVLEDIMVSETVEETENEDLETLRTRYHELGEHFTQARKEIQSLQRRVTLEAQERQRAIGKVKRLTEQAGRAESASQNAMEARTAAEQRVKGLRQSLEKSHADIKRLIELRKREKEEASRTKATSLLSKILPVLDNLQLAVSHSEGEPAQVIEGIRIIVKQFESIFDRMGMQSIDADPGTPFDPEIHEAVDHVVRGPEEEGLILDEISRGYTLDGRLLRAARVQVATTSDAPLPKRKTESQTAEE